MHIVVFIAGIADPKKPLPPNPDPAHLRAARTGNAALSPFDEAAIEVALKLRDADPAVQVSAWVAADESNDPLLRTVASLRIEPVSNLRIKALPAWDAHAMAQALAWAFRHEKTPPDLVLTGREFGDFDDGSVPALLAGELGLEYRSLVTSIRREGPDWSVLRQRAGQMRRVACRGAFVASVTNDAGNRLRHPLLKNVMAARKASFQSLDAPIIEAGALRCLGAAPAEAARRGGTCRMLGPDLGVAAREMAGMLLAVA